VRGRPFEHRVADGTRGVRLRAQGRDPALSVAPVGVRRENRPVLFDPVKARVRAYETGVEPGISWDREEEMVAVGLEKGPGFASRQDRRARGVSASVVAGMQDSDDLVDFSGFGKAFRSSHAGVDLGRRSVEASRQPDGL
jgi:hypothetical protein